MIAFALAVLCSAQTQTDSASDAAQRLRLMTYNIHHAAGTDKKLDVDRIAELLQAEAPDIVCLQEVDRNLPRSQHLDIAKILGEKLGMTALFEPNFQFSGGDYGNAILSKLPVIRHENLPLPGPEDAEPRGCLIADMQSPWGILTVASTHWGLNAAERADQGKALAAHLSGKKAVLIAGDFNEDSDQHGLSQLLAQWKDSWLHPTPPKTYPAAKPDRRIDFILVSPDWNVLSSRVVKNTLSAVASDHLPCFIELSGPKPGAATATKQP